MEIPIQVAVRIYPYNKLHGKSKQQNNGERDKNGEAAPPSTPVPSTPHTPNTGENDYNGNERTASDANGNNINVAAAISVAERVADPVSKALSNSTAIDGVFASASLAKADADTVSALFLNETNVHSSSAPTSAAKAAEHISASLLNGTGVDPASVPTSTAEADDPILPSEPNKNEVNIASASTFAVKVDADAVPAPLVAGNDNNKTSSLNDIECAPVATLTSVAEVNDDAISVSMTNGIDVNAPGSTEAGVAAVPAPLMAGNDINKTSTATSIAKANAGSISTHLMTVNNITATPAAPTVVEAKVDAVSPPSFHGNDNAAPTFTSKTEVNVDAVSASLLNVNEINTAATSTSIAKPKADTELTQLLNANDVVNDDCCVQAIPITASALGLPTALPGGTHLDSIAAGLIHVGAHTVPVTHALDSETTQSQVYHQTVFPLIGLFLEGFDASVVTYGQRSTGKSYTLYGKGVDSNCNDEDEGVVQRCAHEIFKHIAANMDRTYAVNVGFVEICGGEIRDLLGMGNVHCNNTNDIFHWLEHGLRVKSSLPDEHIAHTLFTITLEQQWVSKEGMIQHRLSTASFSDLCATERWGDAPPGMPRDAGLQMVEQVVNTLTNPAIMYGINGNVPYGQTTLTTLLKDSFGGRAQTLVILCVSPLEKDLHETLGNLQFAFKVQCVRNYVIMNTFSDDNTPLSPDPMPTETPREGGAALLATVVPSNADTFGLQFAASQWFKLVSNAEGLFAKLMSSSAVTDFEKEQIEEWLFLKQECEECLSSNEALRTQKQLVPIQEIEEPEESASEQGTSCQQNSDNDTDTESQRPDLAEKLESLMEEFRAKTDALIQSKHLEFLLKHPKAVMESQESFKSKPLKLEETSPDKLEDRKASMGGRRRSIQPGASLTSAELAMLNRVASQQQPEQAQELDLLDSSSGDGLQSANVRAAAAANAPIEQIQKKLRKLDADIEARQRQLKEIEQTAQLKQNIISELIKNSETRSNAKQRFNKKKAKLEAEYDKAKKHMAKALIQGKEKAEIERCSSIIAHIEQRLQDLSSMKHIASESGYKIKKLQQSMADSRRQMDELQRKLKKEGKLRNQLDGELKTLKDAREAGKALIKVETPAATTPDTHGTQLKAVQARITHLNHILREKSENLETVPAAEQQESLRHEIRNLRRTRDHLLEQRCALDRKLKRDKMLTQREERKLLECDEAIEAIDAAIEFKNELICGHKSIDTSERLQREKGEQMLMARLNKLSLEEMRTLLYKYFIKVIDLRDSSRKLEQQLGQLERERDAWEWKERVLSNAVRQARLEGERNAVLLQRQHEMKLTLMLRHLAEETSASSASYSERGGGGAASGGAALALEPAHNSSDFDYELDFYKAASSTQSKGTLLKTPTAAFTAPAVKPPPSPLDKYKDATKERSGGRNIFAKFQVLTRYASAAAAVAGSPSMAEESAALIETTTGARATASSATTAKPKEKAMVIIPQEQLKRLMPPPSATKVTRRKNKIIIQDATRN